ncbi:MAG: hypothetical protein HQ519_14590 [Planctomycetes bacterium]|nr:hypothetical protein [Planctomycetota bacterium]
MKMHSRFHPDDFGDHGLRHEVNVFVYRDSSEGLEYLLLRPQPSADSLWRPVVRVIQFHQDLRQAAVTAVRDEIGLANPFDLHCPALGIEEDVGDLHLVGWPVGFRLRKSSMAIPTGGVTRAADAKQVAQMGWMDFQTALHALGLSQHRQNLLQLHWQLAA